jgi:hypothetical protein
MTLIGDILKPPNELLISLSMNVTRDYTHAATTPDDHTNVLM